MNWLRNEKYTLLNYRNVSNYKSKRTNKRKQNNEKSTSDWSKRQSGLLNAGIDRLMQLNFAYTNANIAEARELIGLIYPENFTFRNNQFQTARVHEIASRIYLINNNLFSKKNGTKENIFSLSRKVTATLQFTNHFMKDLKKLAYFSIDL